MIAVRKIASSFWFAVAVLLAAVTQSLAVIAIDASGPTTAIFSTASSGAVNVTTTSANDIIILVVSSENGTVRTVSTVTDVAGLTWAKRSGRTTSTVDLEVWWALSTGALSADTITVTLSGATDDASLIAYGVSGANTASPWDANVSLPATSSASNPPSVGGVSTSSANAMILGFCGDDKTTTQTSGAGYTLIATRLNGGGIQASSVASEDQVVSATQSGITVAFGSLTSSGDSVAIADALVQASAGAAARPIRSLIGVGR